MSLDTNVFVENLKTVLSQFELPEEKVMSETLRLERLKRRLALEVKDMEDEVAIKGYAFYAFGLSNFKKRSVRSSARK